MAEPRSLTRDHECVHDGDFARLEMLVSKVFGKMDAFIEEMHGIIVADATRQARLEQHDRDIDRAFVEIRDLETRTVKEVGAIKSDIKGLTSWKDQFSGGVKVMLAVPVICAVITTVVAVYSLMHR